MPTGRYPREATLAERIENASVSDCPAGPARPAE